MSIRKTEQYLDRPVSFPEMEMGGRHMTVSSYCSVMISLQTTATSSIFRLHPANERRHNVCQDSFPWTAANYESGSAWGILSCIFRQFLLGAQVVLEMRYDVVLKRENVFVCF